VDVDCEYTSNMICGLQVTTDDFNSFVGGKFNV
jgi:hypothetical protein